jgi:hypothetical protein
VTIEKGKAWGEHGSLPPDGVVVASDAEARAVIERAHRAGGELPVLGLTGGDLCRTLGGPAGLSVAVSVDLGAALVDGRLHWFVAHLFARTRAWGRVVAAMNAQWRGGWNVAPRGHPNDGQLEVFEAELNLTDRLKVRSRLASGTHLPHPRIKTRQTRAAQFEFGRPTSVELDGEPVGTARTLTVRVEPDGLKVVV